MEPRAGKERPEKSRERKSQADVKKDAPALPPPAPAIWAPDDSVRAEVNLERVLIDMRPGCCRAMEGRRWILGKFPHMAAVRARSFQRNLGRCAPRLAVRLTS